jgi:hypothetical protein
MFPPPEGVYESEAQAQELDDTFLSSDPLGYFMSRIAMMHHWASCGTAEQTDSAGTAVLEGVDEAEQPTLGAVGRPEVNAVIEALFKNTKSPQLPKLVVTAQVAVDAFAMRHHLAEAVLRLFVGCVEDEQAGEGDPPQSLWARLTDNKETRIDQLLTKSRELLHGLMPEKFAPYVLPPEIPVTEENYDQALTTVRTYGPWLVYAMDLLAPGELDTTSAHNKVKHGLAVRGDASRRVVFTAISPNTDGTMEASALTGEDAMDIFKRPLLEFLARTPWAPEKGKRGLELTQLELDYRVILADAAMMALVHGALFHVAAHRHFAGRELPRGLTVAPHPGFVAQLPEPNHAVWPYAMRFPITAPEHGGPHRPAVISLPDGSFRTVEFGEAMKDVRIVDSKSDPRDSEQQLDPEPDQEPDSGA